MSLGGNKTATQNAVWAKRAMQWGIGLSISGGVIAIFVNSKEAEGLYNFFAISGTIFTISGFIAAYFQLKTASEVKRELEIAVKNANENQNRIQLASWIAKAQLQLEKLAENLANGDLVTYSKSINPLILNLEAIRQNKLIQTEIHNLIKEHIEAQKQLESLVNNPLTFSERKVLELEIINNFKGKITFINGILENVLSSQELKLQSL